VRITFLASSEAVPQQLLDMRINIAIRAVSPGEENVVPERPDESSSALQCWVFAFFNLSVPAGTIEFPLPSPKIGPTCYREAAATLFDEHI
jgi:hypothetical protein